MYASLRKALVIAQDEEPQIGHMRCLIDQESHKMANKIYSKFLGTDNMSKFPLFMAQLDELLFKLGGRPDSGEEEESEQEDDDGTSPEEDNPNPPAETEDEDTSE